MLDLDVSFSHVKFQVCKMKGSEVTAVSAGDVFSAIFNITYFCMYKNKLFISYFIFQYNN